MDVIREFLEIDMKTLQVSQSTWQVQVGPKEKPEGRNP
jgi:hypothetical protein